MQALFATVVQLCIVMTLIYNPVLKVRWPQAVRVLGHGFVAVHMDT
jgi:hypothetical protein